LSIKVVFASGKGGTGKTLLSVNMAVYFKDRLNKKVVLVDLDVEEPNSSLFLKGDVKSVYTAERLVPQYDRSRCNDCRICANVCNFNALIKAKEHVLIYKNLCHSCNACVKLCPTGALHMEKSRIGEIREIETDFGIPMIDGTLDIKEEMSAPLIAMTKKKAEELYKDSEYVFYDSPPGTSCSYIEGIKDADLILIVTEPTPFGKNDSTLAIESAMKLGKKIGVIINRSSGDDHETRDYYFNMGILNVTTIPNRREIAEIYSEGKLVLGSDKYFDESLDEAASFILKWTNV